jgi:hypothetical protein
MHVNVYCCTAPHGKKSMQASPLTEDLLSHCFRSLSELNITVADTAFKLTTL